MFDAPSPKKQTYRIRGHYEGDPQNYRTREEIALWREQCAIRRFREVLLKDGVDENELDAIDARIETELEAAIAFAEESPLPDMSQARYGIFTETAEVA